MSTRGGKRPKWALINFVSIKTVVLSLYEHEQLKRYRDCNGTDAAS